MKNIRIEVKAENYITVTADTERFGPDEILFEGNTFSQCFEFIKRETGLDTLPLRSGFLFETYTDRAGRSFPWYMEVIA